MYLNLLDSGYLTLVQKLLTVVESIYGPNRSPKIFIYDSIAQIHPTTWPFLVSAGQVFLLHLDNSIHPPIVLATEVESIIGWDDTGIGLYVDFRWAESMFPLPPADLSQPSTPVQNPPKQIWLPNMRTDSTINCLATQIRQSLKEHQSKPEIFLGTELKGELTLGQCGIVNGGRVKCVVY